MVPSRWSKHGAEEARSAMPPSKDIDENDMMSCASVSTASNFTPGLDVGEWDFTNVFTDGSTSVTSASASTEEWRQELAERRPGCSKASLKTGVSADVWGELDSEEVISRSAPPAVWSELVPDRALHEVGSRACSDPVPGAVDGLPSTITPGTRFTVKNTFIDVEELPVTGMLRARRMSAPAALSSSQVVQLPLPVAIDTEQSASVGDAPAEVADRVARRAALAKMAAMHEARECTPCNYFWFKADGCRQGELCRYCHFCTKSEIRKVKKSKAKQLRRLQAQADGEQETMEARDA